VLNNSIRVEDIEADISGTYANTSLTLHRTDAGPEGPGPYTSPNSDDVFSSNIPGTSLTEGANVLDMLPHQK